MLFARSTKLAALLSTLLMVLAMSSGAFAVEPARGPGTAYPTVTPEQAKDTLSILQNDRKRADLERTLSAIAQATQTEAAPAQASAKPVTESATEGRPAAAPAPTAAPVALTQNGLLAQVFSAAELRLHAVGRWLQITVRTVLNVRAAGLWWQEAMGTEAQKAKTVEVLWKAIVVLAGGLLAEWMLRWVLARPQSLLRHRAAANSTAQASPPPVAERYLALLHRFPFAVMHFLLELLPLLAFLGGASVLLNAIVGQDIVFNDFILPLISAYAAMRISLAALQLILSPQHGELRLIRISDTAASYLLRWLRRIIVLAVFGMAIGNVLGALGINQETHDVFNKLTSLAVHIALLIMMWRSRKPTAAALRGTSAEQQSLLGLRGFLADIWPAAAGLIIVALWLLWSVGTDNGFQRLIHFFAWSAAVIVSASLISIFILGTVDRAFSGNRDNMAATAIGENSKSMYQRLLHRAVRVLIVVATFIVLLQVWGVDTQAWFEEGSVGRRLASATAIIVVACALALAAWDGLNTTIARRINNWTQAGDFARAARLRTLVPMLRTTLFIIIAMIVLLTALNQLGITIAPLLAGASIIGVALGFGSQKLVQDFITGLFLLMENAMQVGDFVTVAGLSGTVEYLSIRTVRLRAGDGSLHVVPFSSVSTVTNTNRGIGNASVKVSVAADSDVDNVFNAIQSVGADLRADANFKNLILADLDIWGIDQVDGSMISISGQIRTRAKGRWPVQREFNRRILQRFRERGIKFVNPNETRIIGSA